MNAGAAKQAAEYAEAAAREARNNSTRSPQKMAKSPNKLFQPFSGKGRLVHNNKTATIVQPLSRNLLLARTMARQQEGVTAAKARVNANRARAEAIAKQKEAKKKNAEAAEARRELNKATARAAAVAARAAKEEAERRREATASNAARRGAAAAAIRRANKNANERYKARLANEAKQWNAMVEALRQRPRGRAADLEAWLATRPLFGPENMRTRRKGNKPKRN